ncbi:hypothetical protein F5X68DRAFT_209344 [Plectosphaerella plurivora]|uniref:Stress response RCI peptide n=1 Tax=Plectosphaerella plurivora TaxID=936078 RepID=A0A9P8VAP2_9PEZI|nr:hypothetical protein F5X68DRAFT_209344 [Plectosphaerella plurivora]
MCSSDIFLGFLAILFPPLPVWVKRGICSADSIINILLCVLGFIPGLIHAWYIIAKYPDPADEYERLGRDGESGRVYVYVHHGQPQRQEHPSAKRQQKKGGPAPLAASNNVNYGTNGPSASQQPQQPNGGEGSSDGAAPPSYAAVVAAGDNKVQSRE